MVFWQINNQKYWNLHLNLFFLNEVQVEKFSDEKRMVIFGGENGISHKSALSHWLKDKLFRKYHFIDLINLERNT